MMNKYVNMIYMYLAVAQNYGVIHFPSIIFSSKYVLIIQKTNEIAIDIFS